MTVGGGNRVASGRDSVRQHVSSSIKDFVSSCLRSDFDVIVPIESEGMALMLPFLSGADRGTPPQICVSESLAGIEPSDMKGKRILIVDAAVDTGYTILDVRSSVQERFGESAAIAAFLVREGFAQESELAIPDYIRLPPREYSWAREVIIEYLLDEVFVHYYDPPLWELAFDKSRRFQILEQLLLLSNSYYIPGDVGPWIRLSIGDIQLVDSSWLPEQLQDKTPSKLRFLLNKSDNIVRILPLFFPRIPVDLVMEGEDLKDSFLSTFPREALQRFLGTSSEGLLTSQDVFRLTSTLGSLLLLREILLRLRALGMDISADNLKLSEPAANLYSFVCRETGAEIILELAQSLILSESGNGGQLGLSHRVFGFGESDGDKALAFAVGSPHECYSPEESLATTLGVWLVEKEQTTERAQLPGPDELSMEKLRTLTSKFMTSVALNRALDSLIDEGFLKPRVGRINRKAIGRVYSLGGETVRKRLRALGLAVLGVERGAAA